MTNEMLYLWAALFGLVFGSFANVLILRDRKRASILTGRSQCPSCKKDLAWYELVPVLSFMAQGGRCRSCKKPISWQYPVVESLMAGLFALAMWYGWVERGSWGLGLGLAAGFFFFLVVSGIDVHTQEVPLDYVVAGGIAATVGMATINLSLHTIAWGLLVGAGSIALVSAVWWLMFRQEGMGSGDIWIAGALGAALGYPLIVMCLMLAVYAGALVGIGVAARTRQKNMTLPFGPFLFAGFVGALIWGQAIIDWYIL